MANIYQKFTLVAAGTIMSLAVIEANPSQAVTIDFEGVAPFQDFPTFSEEGFILTTNVGEVRINDAFSPGNNAAQPSFGFGQGLDSSFTLTNDNSRLFNVLSIDLLEATTFPDTFGVTIIGTKFDFTTVMQTFTLDGIAGIETFAFLPEFTNLISLKVVEDSTNTFLTDVVQIDNIQLSDVSAVPEPSIFLGLATALGFGAFSKRKSSKRFNK